MGRCWGSKIAGMFFAAPAAVGNNVTILSDIVLASCTNTTAPTTILTVPIPGNTLTDGSRIQFNVVFAYLNTTGGIENYNIDIYLGAELLMSQPATWSNTGAALRYNRSTFELMRIGSEAWLATENWTSHTYPGGITNYSGWFTDDLSAFPGNRSTAATTDFTADNDLTIIITPATASPALVLNAVQADATVITNLA